MILITTYYKSRNINRQSEIDICLKKNFENKYIKKIYLLNNEIFDLNHININYKNKIEQIVICSDINYKLNYKDAIEFINNNLIHDICILANSDIYFNDSLSKITNKNINNYFFALLRYDEDENGKIDIFRRYNEPRDDSQDSWIFRAPLNINTNNLKFSFGTLGCDSIFASLVYDTKINISNPSYDIVSIHLHNSNHRTYNYDDRIHGKYCLLKPCFLNEYYEPTFMDY